MILKRGLTRCYDCLPKAPPKTYQVCTIRTLPEKPLHCIIWAKHLFGVMFGPEDESILLTDLKKDFENRINKNRLFFYLFLYFIRKN